jgi:hypothetical protein
MLDWFRKCWEDIRGNFYWSMVAACAIAFINSIRVMALNLQPLDSLQIGIGVLSGWIAALAFWLHLRSLEGAESSDVIPPMSVLGLSSPVPDKKSITRNKLSEFLFRGEQVEQVCEDPANMFFDVRCASIQTAWSNEVVDFLY